MSPEERRDPLRATAAGLFEQTSDAATKDTNGALDRWLNASPEHVAAYRAVARTWVTLKSAAEDPGILELRQQAAQRLAAPRNNRRSWAAAATVLLVLCATVGFLSAGKGFDLSSLGWLRGETFTPTRSFSTGTGDRLNVTLDDGSHLTLNTDTQMDVSFSNKTRRVLLSRGQALFEVAKDASRPFVVQTQNHRFIAVGTAFDVRVNGLEVKVTMLEGTVRAESTEPASQTRTTVTAGQQLIAESKGPDRIRRIDPERETSWRHGQATFDNTPLGDAIAELNRYSTTKIVLADPTLANLRLSGTFATGQTGTFVEAVTAYFPLQVAGSDPQSVMLKARP